MTADQPPPAAVEIAAIGVLTRAYDWMTVKEARAAVAALAHEGWLTPPDRVAALEAVRSATARFVYGPPGSEAQARYEALQRALDAATAGTATRTYDQLTEQEGGPPNDRINDPPAAGVGLPHFCP
jgi:hypothetical protein